MRKILLILGILLNLLSLIMAFITSFSSILILIFCLSAIVTVVMIVFFVVFVGFNIFLYQYAQNNTVTYKEDALIVLGAGINGETPSLILTERLNAAIQYFNKNSNIIIVVSGGQGPNEKITEALAMERYLVDNGIPIDKILKEDKATSTYENMAFSKELLDNYFGSSYNTAFVTNDFHILRTNMIADKLGLDTTYIHAKIPTYSIPANYLRETIAIVFQVIFSC